MHLHRPDGEIPALSDSDSGSHLDLLEVASAVLDDPELRHVATSGREGTPPAETCADFPVGGYHVQRSGWGDRGEPYADERFLVLGCGPLGDGGHGHYDALSVEAYGLGHPLVVDPGRYTYAEGDPNWRHWFKGTAAHNTVTVDGLDQQPYRRGKPKRPLMTGRLLDRRSQDGVELLHGTVTSPAYDATHDRVVLFVAGEYWLVVDLLHAPQPHDYTLRWHLAPGAAPALTRLPGGTRAETPAVRLDVVGDATVAVEPGWVSPEYGVKHPAPVVVASAPRTAQAVLVTLLAPRREGRAPRLLESDIAGGRWVVELADGSTDLLAWRPGRLHADLAGRPPGGLP
jgi:hypothetical protein